MSAQENTKATARTSGPRFRLEDKKEGWQRYIFPILLGVIGAGILCWLGIWQVQRLEWKEGKIAEIEQGLATIGDSLPENANYDVDNYRGVEVGGNLVGPELHVLTSLKPQGPGFRVIRKMDILDGRTILVDLGYVPETQKDAERFAGAVFIQGNLIWPNETDSFTPDANLERNVWFARDVDKMADALGAEPLLVTARTTVPVLGTTLMPVTVNVPNNHLQYAITWFSLMAIWIVMTLLLLWRIKRAEA